MPSWVDGHPGKEGLRGTEPCLHDPHTLSNIYDQYVTLKKGPNTDTTRTRALLHAASIVAAHSRWGPRLEKREPVGVRAVVAALALYIIKCIVCVSETRFYKSCVLLAECALEA